ncbi:MAG: DUF1893 domain-containing protein [Clostridia bacterium]|nr:DUF1893 domain-containing protein [Clostridia bacterium]
MNKDILTAKKILIENDYTCVLYSNGKAYHSTLRGVKPLIDFLESNFDSAGYYAADKVVGAGAAHLYVLLGVKAVWAKLMSKDAMDILQTNGIDAFYDDVVPYIINRSGEGACPIETAVKEITDSKQALDIIKQTLEKLSKRA